VPRGKTTALVGGGKSWHLSSIVRAGLNTKSGEGGLLVLFLKEYLELGEEKIRLGITNPAKKFATTRPKCDKVLVGKPKEKKKTGDAGGQGGKGRGNVQANAERSSPSDTRL